MFWRKKKQAEAPALPADGPIIAALLIKGTTYDLAGLQKKLAGARIAGESFGGLEIRQGILTGDLGDELIAIAPMPAPYPWSDLEGPCQTSWTWPKGTSAMDVKPHKTHVLITAVRGQADRVRRRLKATQVTGLAAEMPGVMGILWAEGTMVHSPALFIEMAREMTEAPPL